VSTKSKILIVEDNASVRDALSDYLEAQGFEVAADDYITLLRIRPD
jgi:DNA-binding response OmpR family regulator